MDNSDNQSQDQRQQHNGRRLRVDGQKRTENEYRQMLRLAEIENRELKDSLRYVEVQLAKTKDGLRISTKKYDETCGDLQKAHEQISRQANINHAQVSQIEDMAKKLSEVDNVQREIHEKNKAKQQQYQNEIDLREMEIQRIKKLLEAKDSDCQLLTTQLQISEDRANDLDAEMEMKSGENNRLRKQVADIESAMQDLYKSRKGKGTLQIEMESLKSDNEHLLALLRETSEYADFEDKQILKSAMTKSMQGSKGIEQAFKANKRARTGSADATGNTKPKAKFNNDWIPTEAVRAILQIKDEFKGQMTETAVSQILYQLNTIWRNIMRQETEAIKRRLMMQIQDLRRQVVTKQAYDKGELMQEITTTKKQLGFANKQLMNRGRIGGSKENSGAMNTNGSGDFSNEDMNRTIKLVETIGIEKKQLQQECLELRSRLDMIENEKIHTNPRVMTNQSHGTHRHGLAQSNFDGLTNSEEAL